MTELKALLGFLIVLIAVIVSLWLLGAVLQIIVVALIVAILVGMALWLCDIFGM